MTGATDLAAPPSPSSFLGPLGRSLHSSPPRRQNRIRSVSLRGARCGLYRARLSWILPTPLLLFSGLLELLPVAAVVRRPTSAPRLVAEAFITALAVIALVWLAWVALWRIEHR